CGSTSPRRMRPCRKPPPGSRGGTCGFPAAGAAPPFPGPRPSPRRYVLCTRAGRGGDMNAMDLLKEDHDQVKEMFDRFRDLGLEDRAEKQRLFNRIAEALEIHAELEERIFYPAVRSVKSED